MKILVTGADGFTGQHFVQHAQLMGDEVYSLQANLVDEIEVCEEVAKCSPDLVLHLADISYVGHPNPKDFYAINWS